MGWPGTYLALSRSELVYQTFLLVGNVKRWVYELGHSGSICTSKCLLERTGFQGM